MLHIALFEPRIPQNTGNIARTCAVTGTTLHLIQPYAFEINDRNLKRAGLTYWEILDVREYASFADFIEQNQDKRMFLLSSKGDRTYAEVQYQDGDLLLFGREDTGVPQEVHQFFEGKEVRIPMRHIAEARCLNIATSVGVALYEALRQIDFNGLE